MSDAELSYEVDDRVGILTFDRPPVNAVRYEDLEALTDRLTGVPEDGELVVVLQTGGKKIFTAGHDVSEFREYDPAEADYRDEVYMSLLETVYDLPIPTIVAVDGPAVGAGAILASLCDLRVAEPGASFAVPEIDVGIVGGYGPLRRLLPDDVARHMLYTGEPISAERAHELGMVSVLAADAREAAGDLAVDMAAKSPDAIRAARSVARESQPDWPIEEYRREREHIAKLREKPNTTEAAVAFLEDREPEFEYQ